MPRLKRGNVRLNVYWKQLIKAGRAYQGVAAAEAETRRQVSKKDHEMPVFYFEAESVLRHIAKVSNIDHRIIYLQYLMKEYPEYLKLRRNILAEKFNRKIKEDPDFIKRGFTAIASLMKEMKDEIQKLNKPELSRPFEERIRAELEYLGKTKFLNKGEYQEALKQINDPAGMDIPKPKKQPMDDVEDYLNIKEASNFLKCAESTIYNWRKKEIITGYKIGNKTLYKKSELIAAIEKK